MSEQKNVQHSRRRLIKAVAGSGSVIVGAKAIPREWTKPVVDSVVLPAHAQASPGMFSLSCVSAPDTPPNGSDVTPDDVVSVIVTVSPNPGAGEQIDIEVFCDDALTDAGFGLTDAAGQYTDSATVSSFMCGTGVQLRARFTYMGASAECFWNIAGVIG